MRGRLVWPCTANRDASLLKRSDGHGIASLPSFPPRNLSQTAERTPHRGVDAEGGGEPFVVLGEFADAIAKHVPRVGGWGNALARQQLKGVRLGKQLLRAVSVLSIQDVLTFGHQNVVISLNPRSPAEACDVFTDPFIRALGARMTRIAPVQILQGDVGKAIHGKGFDGMGERNG